jgi:hypothetical protein
MLPSPYTRQRLAENHAPSGIVQSKTRRFVSHGGALGASGLGAFSWGWDVPRSLLTVLTARDGPGGATQRRVPVVRACQAWRDVSHLSIRQPHETV